MDVPWWIAGGWALDLFVGRQTRVHTDIEISVYRGDEDKVRERLKGWEFFVAKDGTLTPLAAGKPLPADGTCASGVASAAAIRGSSRSSSRSGRTDAGSTGATRRIGVHEKDIGRFTNDGIPYVRPEIQLLYKSKGPRAVDESDLLARAAATGCRATRDAVGVDLRGRSRRIAGSRGSRPRKRRTKKDPDLRSGSSVFYELARIRRNDEKRTDGPARSSELQYTGLSPRGWNGTRASPPQLLHVAVKNSRGPALPPPAYPPAPPPEARRAVRQDGQRPGSFTRPRDW